MKESTVHGDLHVHTTASDGTVTVEERIEQAEEINLKAIAITDHDTIASMLTARREQLNDIEIITGVEVRADILETKIEILGYYIDPTDRELQKLLQRARAYRKRRNDEMLQALRAETGIELSKETITSDGKSLGRPHMAAALVDHDIVSSVQAAFDEFLADDASCFIPMERIDSEEVIQTIQNAGGVASLAHPGRISASKESVNRMISELSNQGLDAIEISYPYGESGQRYADIGQADASEFADEHALLRTGGSDCHGPDSGKLRLGIEGVSQQTLSKIRTKASIRRSFGE